MSSNEVLEGFLKALVLFLSNSSYWGVLLVPVVQAYAASSIICIFNAYLDTIFDISYLSSTSLSVITTSVDLIVTAL